MVKIPTGTFLKGAAGWASNANERPQHEVTISRSFFICKYEVTQAQWKAVMGTTPWSGLNFVIEQDECAASYVTHLGAREFCEGIEEMTGLAIRLPTASEWEFACRAGSGTPWYGGDGFSNVGRYAWYEENANFGDERYPHPVGMKLPNAYGLYDMQGNVWEWVQDRYNRYENGPPTDGSAWLDGLRSEFVLRGGSWFRPVKECKPASRIGRNQDESVFDSGFRIAMDAE